MRSNSLKGLSLIMLVALLMPLSSGGQPSQQTTSQGDGSTLATIRDRGTVICGANSSVPGFGFLDPATSRYSGFDIDYCRALAVAIFNDPNAVAFRPLTSAERFTTLAAGEIDVLIRNTTWTFDRDVALATNFAPTTFYDGQGFMVRRDSGINTIENLAGATICVLEGTTTEQNLADEFRQRGLDFTPLSFAQVEDRDQAYDQSRCVALTADASQLAGIRTRLSNPEAHQILPKRISKEPLGPVVRQGDDQWFDIVKWTVFCTFEAEELGITSRTVDEQLGSNAPRVRRLLGVEGALGSQFGLGNDFCANVIRRLGNYGEIYERNLTPVGLTREDTLNALHTRGGLIYSPPFR